MVTDAEGGCVSCVYLLLIFQAFLLSSIYMVFLIFYLFIFVFFHFFSSHNTVCRHGGSFLFLPFLLPHFLLLPFVPMLCLYGPSVQVAGFIGMMLGTQPLKGMAQASSRDAVDKGQNWNNWTTNLGP